MNTREYDVLLEYCNEIGVSLEKDEGDDSYPYRIRKPEYTFTITVFPQTPNGHKPAAHWNFGASLVKEEELKSFNYCLNVALILIRLLTSD